MERIFTVIKSVSVDIWNLLKEQHYELSKTKNRTGDIQLKVDLKSNDLIKTKLSSINLIQKIASEEDSDVIELYPNGKYLVAYDPIDGSSLFNSNLSTGSIFSIYEDSFNGRSIKACIYTIYGVRLELVVAYNKEVRLYRYNKNGEFLFDKMMCLSNKGFILSPGALQKEWYSKHKELINCIFSKGYTLRYSGAMVCDLHNILVKGGGLFAYPKTKNRPRGKLRTLFEVFPFAFTFELAGGLAIDGKNNILDAKIEHEHDTTPCFFGSKHEIEIVKRYYGK